MGGVLEEHLRQLCIKFGIELTIKKGKNNFPKKANSMNDDLARKQVYNKLKHKSMTASLDLRNKAAHGNYSDYNEEDVNIMLQAASNFINQNPI